MAIGGGRHHIEKIWQRGSFVVSELKGEKNENEENNKKSEHKKL